MNQLIEYLLKLNDEMINDKDLLISLLKDKKEYMEKNIHDPQKMMGLVHNINLIKKRKSYLINLKEHLDEWKKK